MSVVELRAFDFTKSIVMRQKPVFHAHGRPDRPHIAQVVYKMCSQVRRQSLDGPNNLKKIKRWRQSGQLYGNQALCGINRSVQIRVFIQLNKSRIR